jgi:hypothetical protein
MPPKVKPLPTKPTKKDSAAADAMPPPPAPKPPENLSVDSTDKFLVAYHTKGKHDVADVMFHVNGVLRDTDYRVSVAADRKSFSWQCTIHTICFSKKILEAILKNGYSASSHRAVAYDDVAQEMQAKKIRPEHKLFWGAPQVVRIKWECTGAIVIIKRDYPIDYVIVDSKGRKDRQCNSVLIVQVKRAKERAATEAEVDTGQISLFGAFRQSSNASDGPPSPPPRRKSPRLRLLRNQQQQQKGTGWTRTTTTTAVGANSLMRTTAATRTTMEGGDTVATEEGNGRGATSGCNKYIITQ